MPMSNETTTTTRATTNHNYNSCNNRNYNCRTLEAAVAQLPLSLRSVPPPFFFWPHQCKHSLESTLGGSSMTKASPDYVKVQYPFRVCSQEYPTLFRSGLSRQVLFMKVQYPFRVCCQEYPTLYPSGLSRRVLFYTVGMGVSVPSFFVAPLNG